MGSEEEDFNKFLPNNVTKDFKDTKKMSKSTDGNNNEAILKFLATMETNMNQKLDTLSKNHNDLSARVSLFEGAMDSVEFVGPDEDHNSVTVEDITANLLDEPVTQTPVDTPQAPTGEIPDDEAIKDAAEASEDLDILDEFIKLAEVNEQTDEDVDPKIATIVNSLFRKQLDKELYKKMMDDTSTARPKNCTGLQQVVTNRMIWDTFSEITKANDKKLQLQQKSIVKAGSLMTKVMAMLVKAKSNPTALDLKKLLTLSNSTLTVLGDLNFKCNMFRRTLMKKELNESYKKLCLDTIPFTSELFGDELAKLAKDIGETNKIGNKLRFNTANSFRGKYPSKFYARRASPYSFARGAYNNRGSANRGGYRGAQNQRNFHQARGGRMKR